MPKPEFFSLKSYKLVFWIVIGWIAAYTLVNLFVIGGDDFVIGLTDFYPIILASLTTLFAYLLWRKFPHGSAARTVWIYFVIGWGSWTLGELVYFLLASSAGEVPYPSIADGLYFFGYFWLARGLFSRLLWTKEDKTTKKRDYIGIAYFIFILIPFLLIILPIIENTDSSNLLTTFTDIAYAAFDITLLLRVIRLLVNYSTRSRTEGWGTLLIGFILMTIADLMYSYTLSYGLYYPEGKVNFITSVGFAIPYVMAYLLWMLGIYRLRIKQNEVQADSPILKPIPVDNSHILFFTDPFWKVDETSTNIGGILTDRQVIGNTLDKVINLPYEIMQFIQSELPVKGRISDLPLNVTDKMGRVLTAKLDGLRILSPEGRFNGAILVVYFRNAEKSLDDGLSDYHRSLIKNVKQKSISKEDQQITEFINRYYEPIFECMEDMVHTHGGYQQSSIFRETINDLITGKWFEGYLGK